MMYPRPTCPIQLVRQAAPTGKILDAPTHCTWCNSAPSDRTYLAVQLFAQYSISWPTWANSSKCIPVAGRYRFFALLPSLQWTYGLSADWCGRPIGFGFRCSRHHDSGAPHARPNLITMGSPRSAASLARREAVRGALPNSLAACRAVR